MPTSSRDRGNDLEGLISVAQAAALLGVHPNTLRAWTDAGRLTAYRINARGDRRYRRGDVELLLAEGGDAPEVPSLPDSRAPRREVEAALFSRLAQGIGPSATPAAVSRSAIEVLRTTLGVARAAIYLVHEARDMSLVLETHAGYHSPPPVTLDPSPLDGNPVRVRSDGTRAQLTLRAAGERIGELILEDEPGGPLRDLSDAFLRNAAGAIAADILNAKVLARARREVSRSRALRHVTQELTGQLDLGAVLDDIVDRTRSLFDADKAGLWLLDDSEHPFSRAASRGLADEFHSRVHGLTLREDAVGVRAIRERRTAVVREADTRVGVGAMQDMYAAEKIKTVCLVPLVINNRAVGLLGLYHARDHEWPEDELALAQSFANQAAVAISNARLYRSVADQAARIRSIQDLSARLNRLTDVQAIADAIVAEASTLAAYHDIRVYQVEWERGICEPIAFTDRLLGDGDFKDALRVDIGEGSFTGWVAANGEPILSNDALHDERGHTIDGTDDIEESMLVVPMLYEGRSVGVIALSKLGNNQFSNDDLQTMTIFAGYAAQAMANAGAYERLELQSAELARQLQSQRRLLEINERLQSTLDRADVLETIADGLQAVVRYDNLSIYRIDEARRVLMPVLTRERHEEEVRRYVVPFGQGLMGWAVDHREPVLANDALTDPRAMQIPGTPDDPEALCVVPLMAEGDVIGCMNISRIGGPEVYFSDADFELVKLFAGQASIALRNADAHQAIALQAETDALTGLGNHGAFQRTLAEVLGQPEAGTYADQRRAPAPPAGPVALLMMDLDNFKAYNDRLGHPAGDALLHAIGAAIQGSARGEDRVFRYGGDEFAVVLPDVDGHAAEAIGERVRQAVARLTAKEAARVTITVGVAAYPADAADKNDLIAAADIALYLGKQAGEDRVVRADQVPNEMRDLRSTLDRLARAALLHPDDAPTVDSLVEQAALLSHASEHGQDTVRGALLGVARSLDALDPAAIGHGERVGRLAGLVARKLGCDDAAADTVELAARLQSLEGVGADELEPIPSLREVGEIVRWHRSGGPLERTPLGAQVLAATNAYDALVASVEGPHADRRAAIDELTAAAGQRYSPAVVRALAAVVGVKPRTARRRRSQDGASGVRGAA